MKYIVLGYGLLGSEIVKQTGWNFISREKDDVNICVPKSYQKKLMQYDVIINCMGYTKTYSNEKETHWNVNVKAVDDLITYCNNTKKKLIHISTDYIYANSKELASENDVPVHIGTWYGYTKLLSDGLVQLRSNNYLICRLSHKPYPFPYDEAWMDIKTNCDYVNVIAELVIKLIKNNSTGVFNVGTEVKTIYDLAMKTRNVIPISKPDYAPDDVSMNIDKLKTELMTY